MNKMFVKTRIGTLIWGFLVIYYYTRQLDLTSKMFLVQAIGNTLIMWFLIKEKK